MPSYRHRNRRRRHDHDHSARHAPGCRNVLRSSHNATARYLYRNPPLLGRSLHHPGSRSVSLTLDADYDPSVPVVTMNGYALTPVASGKYTIADISANLTVAITGIVRNTTTGIEQVENATLIRAESGALLIRTPVSVTAQVIALTGNVVRTVRLPAGDSRVDGLASGIYIVRLSNEITKKVIIR